MFINCLFRCLSFKFHRYLFFLIGRCNLSFTFSFNLNIRELKQLLRRRQQNPTNLHVWQWKTVFLHTLHVHFSSFDILKTFLLFPRREITCFTVVWTTWAYDDKFSILSSYVPRAGSNLIPGSLEQIFLRSYIFRRRSRFRRRRVCLSSQFSK